MLIAAICLQLACSPKPVVEKKPVPQIPFYSAASIAPNGATEPAPLWPGREMSIYGRHLGPAQPCQALCDTEVIVGGTAAALLYVSAEQINFRAPQLTPTGGEVSIRVVHKSQAGPTVSMPIIDSPQNTAKDIAAAMWSNLQRVKWERQYTSNPRQCTSVPAHQGLRGGLYDHAFYCAQTKQDVIAESFYYPVDHEAPKVVLLRADFRPAIPYPELSVEVEQLLIGRLEKAYGAPVTPDNIVEIGAYGPAPGLSWTTGEVTIFLHRNQNAVAPVGVRRGVVLIAVRREVLAQRQAVSVISPSPVAAELVKLLPGTYFLDSGEAERAKAEDRTQRALFQLLRQTGSEEEFRAASLVAADDLTRRLGSLLVIRAVTAGSEHLSVAATAATLSKRLAPYGVKFGEIGHYSGDLTYDHSLLQRAWKEYPETIWGQRAFLMLQRLACGVPHLGCKGPNCFLQVVEQGERFLEQYPDTPFRREQIHHLALAYETWWSVSQKPADPLYAESERVSRASGEAARVKAVELNEELLRTLPGTPEAQAAERALPRLKLKLGTGERTFFCLSC